VRTPGHGNGPAFIAEDARASLTYRTFVQNYGIHVRETRGDETRTLRAAKAGVYMPLFIAEK
jgi:hypothetical protein